MLEIIRCQDVRSFELSLTGPFTNANFGSLNCPTWMPLGFFTCPKATDEPTRPIAKMLRRQFTEESMSGTIPGEIFHTINDALLKRWSECLWFQVLEYKRNPLSTSIANLGSILKCGLVEIHVFLAGWPCFYLGLRVGGLEFLSLYLRLQRDS